MYNEVMNWDSEIELDEPEYSLLPEGDYVGIITNFERKRFPGSAKLEPCNMAEIYMKALVGSESFPVQFNVILNRKLEWKVSGFFRAIGQKKSGEKLTMDWSCVVGSFIKIHISHRKYQGKDGEEHTAINVDKFYDYDPENFKDYKWLEDAADAGEF